MEPSDEPEVRFMETAANTPAAINTWWFPGRVIGHEFIYPREQATRLAQGSRGSVLTVANDANTAEAMRDAELARIDPSAQTTTVDMTAENKANVSGTAVTGRESMETQTAEAQTANPAAQTPTTTQAEPQTAQTQAQPRTAVTTPPPAETPATTVPRTNPTGPER